MTNAKFYRNLICAGLGALALGYFPLSHAGYAQLAPPAGYTPGGGPGGSMTVPTAAAANGASYSGGTVRTNPALNVGGRAVTVSAASRLAANAPRIAAAAIMLHPGLRTAAAVAGWLGAAALVYDVSKGWLGHQDLPVSDGMQYATTYAGPWYPTFEAACSSRNGVIRGGQAMRCWRSANPADPVEYPIVSQSAGASCPKGWFVTPGGCVQTQPMQPISQPDFVERITKNPMPDGVPLEIPHPLPVEMPTIIPAFVPTGNPVPNPSYNPSAPPSTENQPYLQPGINVRPAPAPDAPFQVDLQPVNRPVASPNPGSDPVPNVNPDGTPKPDSGDKPREGKDEDSQDLCEKHPDILACQKLDTSVDEVKIPKAEKTVRYAPENPFGGGSCPADQYAKIGTQQMKVIDWTQDCMFIRDYVRPIAFAITALIVAGILAGALKP